MSDTTETRWERHNEAGRRYFAQGEFGQAEEAFKAAIREATLLGAENLRLAASLSNLGQLKYKQKDHAQAEALFRRSLAIREHVLGPEHQGVVQSVNNLAALYYARGEFDQAEPLFRRALAISEAQLGPEHSDVATALNNLARLCFRRNDTAAAAPLLTRLLQLKEKALGDGHPEIAGILLSLVKVRSAEKQYAEAESLCRRALTIRERLAQGAPDPAVASALEALAEMCGAQGKIEEQRNAIQRARAIRGSSPATPEPGTAPRIRPSGETRMRPSIEVPITTSSLTPGIGAPALSTRPSPPVSPAAPPSAPPSDLVIIGRDEPGRVEPLEVMSVAAQFTTPQPPRAAPTRRPAAPLRQEPMAAPTASPLAAAETDIAQESPRAERTPSAVAAAARRRTPAQQPRFPRRIPTPARLAMAAATAPADGLDPDVDTYPTPEAAPAEPSSMPEFTFGRPQQRRWGVIGGIAAAIALAAVTAWAMVGRDSAEGGAAAPVLERPASVQRAGASKNAMPSGATTDRASAPGDTRRDSAQDATPLGASATAATGDVGAGTARRPALSAPAAGSRTAQESDADRVAIPSAPRIGIDKALRDVEQTAKARVDSASRTIPVKPPTFGRP